MDGDTWDYLRQADRRNRLARLRLGLLLALLAATLSAAVYVNLADTKPDVYSVVRLRTGDGTGSGVIVGYRQIITAAHVVRGCNDVWIDIFDEHGQRTIYGTVVRVDYQLDVALIVASERLSHQVVVAAAPHIDIGHGLYAVGAAMGHTPHTMTHGYLAAKGVPEYEDIPDRWQGSFTVWFGNSGGGVFDDQTGYLVGIVVASDAPNTCFFVTSGVIAGFMEGE